MENFINLLIFFAKLLLVMFLVGAPPSSYNHLCGGQGI